MTPDDTATLMAFLTGGILVGIVGSWMDQLFSFIRK